MNNEDLVLEENYKNHTIKIGYGDFSSPREFDNICVIHLSHSRYDFGDENYSNAQSILEAVADFKKNGDIILPLYMYDHSGITISLKPFSCSWDSGQVGFVQIPRDRMLEEFSAKIFHKALKKKALQIAEAEIKELDDYLRGKTYYFAIEDEDEIEVDRCGGYIGEIGDVMKEAKSIVDNIVEKEKVQC